jgi:4-hydroxybutyrate CoA-transferase
MNWQEKYKDKIVSAEKAVSYVKSGDHIVIAQFHGVSQTLIDALCTRKDELEDVEIFSSYNLKNERYLEKGYEPHIFHKNAFLSNLTRKAYKEGRGRHYPIFYMQFPRWFEEEFKPNVAFVVLSEPDENGICSFSMNSCFINPAVRLAKTVIAHINPNSPRTGGSKISLDDLSWIVYKDEPLGEVPFGRSGEIEQKIASHIATRIPDGACLQLGIGSLPDSILALLQDKKDLGIHTECFSDAVADLAQKGIITNARKQIDQGKFVANFVVGTKKLMKFIDGNEDVLILPVDYTNDPYIIAKNDNAVSINACLEVDLLGQVNAECVNGMQYSGIGGQVDFVRGVTMSKGGQSFIALSSTALKGTVSCIVPTFKPGTAVTTSRYDVQSIVTEYGIADLWGKSLQERARALINIAHPAFREELERDAWEHHILY